MTVIAMIPDTHTTSRASANQSKPRGASGTKRTPTAESSMKGRLTCASADTAGAAICGALDAHSSRSTSAISSVNGMKNLTEAVNQSQYRTLAWFFRHINVSSPTATANRVDCHRWLASSLVISASFPRSAGALIRLRRRHVVDDDHVDRPRLWHQLEPELFLECSEERRRIRIWRLGGKWKTATGTRARNWPVAETQVVLVEPGQAGPIDDKATHVHRKAGRQLRYRAAAAPKATTCD